MTDEELVNRAEEVARKAHAGQIDKAGQPYIEHPRTVASLVKTPKEKAVAWLHDVLEDTSVSEEELRSIFGDEITDAVVLMTHPRGMDYMKYVHRLAPNPLARHAKMADLIHNMDTSRFEGMEIPPRLVEKREKCYAPALAFLRLYDRRQRELAELTEI